MAALRWPVVLILAFAVVGAAARAQDSGAPSAALRQQIRAEAASQIVRADMLGRLLFKTYANPKADDSDSGRAAVAAARAVVKDDCAASYRVVLLSGRDLGMPTNMIPLESADGILAYVIGEKPGKQEVMLGRHYRVELTPDGKTVRSATASTENCLVMSLAALKAAPYIWNGLSNGPTEFHVFLSLLHKAKFRVRAPNGIFALDNGQIDVVGLDPAYRPAKVTLKDCKLPNDKSTFRTTETACRGAGGEVVQ